MDSSGSSQQAELIYLRFFGTIVLVFGNCNGSLSLAILWVTLSAFVLSFIFFCSVSVGFATLQPISWKYWTIL